MNFKIFLAIKNDIRKWAAANGVTDEGDIAATIDTTAGLTGRYTITLDQIEACPEYITIYTDDEAIWLPYSSIKAIHA